MLDTLVYDFVTFFVVLDPVGTAAIFAALTANTNEAQRQSMAWRATILAGIILFGFAFCGARLLTILGVTLPAFRIAGGLLLFLLAVEMVFARPSGLRSVTLVEDLEAEHRRDITVFPLAFPLIAGPGAMTSVLLLMGRAGGDLVRIMGVLGVLALVLLLMLALLLTAARLRHLLGITGSNVFSRVFGVILAALAVQFVLDGLVKVFGL